MSASRGEPSSSLWSGVDLARGGTSGLRGSRENRYRTPGIPDREGELDANSPVRRIPRWGDRIYFARFLVVLPFFAAFLATFLAAVFFLAVVFAFLALAFFTFFRAPNRVVQRSLSQTGQRGAVSSSGGLISCPRARKKLARCSRARKRPAV